MAAARVESAYVNGTGLSSTVARSEAFYEKLLQLHKDVVAGKHPRLTFAHAPTQTDSSLPGLNHMQPSISANSTPAKIAGKNEPTDDPVKLKRIREQRQQLERSIAEYAKADEPILKNAREIPLNLLALAHAQVPPVSGLKNNDSSDDSFDEDSYYSSKANSWSTEHTEPQQARQEAAILISDGEENDGFYEPPTQVSGHLAGVGQSKNPTLQPTLQRNETVNSEWEPDWDEDDDYEPPAPAAFGGSARPQQSSHRQTQGQMQALEYASRMHGSSHAGHGPPQMPGMVAVNQIPTPVAPQPSRISPLTTGNITQAMQSQISNIQQSQGGGQGNDQAVSAKELKKQKRLAKREAKAAAAAAESSKKRKRGGTPPGQHDKKGKRRAVESPDAFIKAEPASPSSAIAAIPSRRPSVVHRNQPEPTVQSSPYRPRSAYVSDQETSPRQYRYADSDRMAMPPPKPVRRERDDQDLRRVASLQYARRPMSPGQEYPTYSPRAAAPRYEYEERPASRAATYREPSVRPSTARPARSPSPRGGDPYSRYAPLQAPRPGQIVTDAYGNRYIAELVPEYPPQSRRPHPDDYYAQYPPRREVYAEDPYRSRAYSQMPEPAPRARAYSQMPEPAADPRASRAYSIHPAAGEENVRYERRRAPEPRYPEYSSDYPPVARAYSTRPETSFRGGEMAPPAVPITRRYVAAPDEGRGQHDDRRSVSYRY